MVRTDVRAAAPIDAQAMSDLPEIKEVDDERALARERIKKRRDFATHVVVYLIFNAVIWGVWALTGAGYPWPAWVTGGWGVGLLMNAWDVYFNRPITDADIDRELHRLHPQS